MLGQKKKFGITMMLTFPGQLQLGDVVASQKVESAWSQEGGGAGRPGYHRQTRSTGLVQAHSQLVVYCD